MIPTEKELVAFIKARDLVNFSIIARHFDIKNSTVTDLVNVMVKKNVVEIKKLGGSKIVRLKNV